MNFKQKKRIYGYLSVILLILMTANMFGQESEKSKTDLNEFLGVRLYKVFKTFGTPRDVFCSADGRGETILDYGAFAFQIGNRTVSIVYFWENFTGKVFGLTIGMTAEQVKKAIGNPNDIKQSKADGTPIWIYNLIDTDRMLVIIFNKSNKIERIQIEWLS